uniref:Uncharacterized protein n=1 Tax=Romanomermis culicivorax TaxID=13658 RepID=A0A915IU38_ROMCU
TDSVVGFAAATTEIHNVGQCKPVNDTENDWGGQCDRIISTDGRYTSASGPFYCLRTAAWNSYGLGTGGRRSIGIDEPARAADVVLSAPAALWILEPDIALRALEFIADGTIHATLVDKILLDGEPSWPAVDAIRRAVEEGSRNTQPTAVVAASPSRTTTGAQTLAGIAQQQLVANAFGETLRTINDDVSIIEVSPFPMATAPRSPKIGVLREVHPCGGLVIDFPSEDLVSSDDDENE